MSCSNKYDKLVQFINTHYQFHANLGQFALGDRQQYESEAVWRFMCDVKDYIDNLDKAINLIVRQANNLKGQLGKHPIKQNVNKLKAVKTMLKRGISPAFYAYEKDRSYSPSFKATDLNYIKKSLQDGKFRRAVSASLLLRNSFTDSTGFNK